MLLTALLFGLISSFHCIGMCGPIAMLLPVDRNDPVKKALQMGTYHFGRLAAYGSIGLLFGLIGKGFYLAGIQQQLSVFIGILMIVVVLVPQRIFARYNFSKPVFRWISKIKSTLGSQFKNKSYRSLFTIGLLNGFLPCGMVYVALFGAIAMQSSGFGLLYMVIFGLGTIPMMTAVVYLQSMITISFRNKIQKAIPYVAVAIGVLFVLRGLGLGIPYISPADVSLFVKEHPDCY